MTRFSARVGVAHHTPATGSYSQGSDFETTESRPNSIPIPSPGSYKATSLRASDSNTFIAFHRLLFGHQIDLQINARVLVRNLERKAPVISRAGSSSLRRLLTLSLLKGKETNPLHRHQ